MKTQQWRPRGDGPPDQLVDSCSLLRRYHPSDGSPTRPGERVVICRALLTHPLPECRLVRNRPETELEMAQRHVREGAERVVRQEALVAALDKDAEYRPQAALARDVTVILRRSLDLMERHLEAIEERSKG